MGDATLKSNIRPTVVFEYRDPNDLGEIVDDESLTLDTPMSNGTGDNQANIMWKDRRIVTAATTDDELDLAGSLVDVFGSTLTFTSIKAIRIHNRGIPDGSGGWTTALGADLLVGGAATDPFTTFLNGLGIAKVTVPSGGVLLMSAPVDGWSVAAGTGDILLASHSGLRGPQLIVNGNFDTGDLSGWNTSGTGDVDYVGGAAVLSGDNQTSTMSNAAAIPLTVGETYTLEALIGGDGMFVDIPTEGVDETVVPGLLEVSFTAVGTSIPIDGLVFNFNSAGAYSSTVDNITLREQALGDIEYDIVLIGTDA